jgi:predicted glycosyltransferase
MRLWVDIANAPHVTFFRPVVEELRRRGHDVVVTAWDRGQTQRLALAEWPAAAMVGLTGFRRPVTAKGTAIWARGRELARRLSASRPDIALGHNSYSQLVAAQLLGVPSVTMMDYEHQPANHLAFRLANRVLVPDAVDARALRRFGVAGERLVRYPGLKEEVALAGFHARPGFRRELEVPEDAPLVTVRPAPEGALYHRAVNPLVDALLPRLERSGATVLLSPRTAAQAARFRASPSVRVLDEPVSGRDLLFHSDVVVGAGGTMTREAAVLGTRSYTAFNGPLASVDHVLIRSGRLSVLRAASDLPLDDVRRVRKPVRPRDRAAVIRFVDLLLASAEGLRRPRGRRGAQ